MIYKNDSIVCSVLAVAGVLSVLALCARNSVWESPSLLSRDILAKNPASEKALSTIAFQYIKSGRADKALSTLKSKEYNGEKGDRYYFTLSLAYFVNGRMEASEEVLEQVTEKGDYISDAYLLRSSIASRKGLVEKSVSYLNISVKYDPGNLDALYRLGMFYASEGHYNRAVSYFATLILKGPDDEEVVKKLAYVIYRIAKQKKKAGDPLGAKRDFFQSVRLLKRNLDFETVDLTLKLFFVDILIEAEDVKQANDYLTKLRRSYPSRPEVLKRYVRFCNRFLMYDKAVKLQKELLGLTGKDNLQSLFLMGEIYYWKREIEKSERTFITCLAICRETNNSAMEVKALNNLANIDLFLEDYEKAEEKFRKALALDMDFWKPYAGLAEIAIIRKEFKTAEQMIREVKKRVPQSFFSLVKLEGLLKKERSFYNELKRYYN